MTDIFTSHKTTGRSQKMAQISDGALRKVVSFATLQNGTLTGLDSHRYRSSGHIISAKSATGQRANTSCRTREENAATHPNRTKLVSKRYKRICRSRKDVWNLRAMADARFIKDDLGLVQKKLEGQIKEQEDSVENLKKKQTYLETTFKNAQSHIDEILRRR